MIMTISAMSIFAGSLSFAQKNLNVRIAGSGDVSYTGNASVKSRVAGSGSVSKR